MGAFPRPVPRPQPEAGTLPYAIVVTRRGRSQRIADVHRLDFARIIARRLMPTADSVVVKDRHGALVFDSALFDGGNDVA